MLEWVKAIHRASKESYGSRRMKKALGCLGYPVSRNKARKLMCPKRAFGDFYRLCIFTFVRCYTNMSEVRVAIT